ncbi:MAG TPA: two pore domain potassium channel family protein [Bacteroidales bacterium]|nr:two pore domain potassium channel family protein [Bacteroidales bacterium]
MIETFNSYKAVKLAIPFTTPNGNIFSHTIALTFFSKSNEIIGYFELGYIPTSEIYEKIFNHEDINLDYCFVENFSLTAYRKIFEFEKKSQVNIKSFSAKHAFFVARITNDFTFAYFEDGNVNFESTYFIKGILDFKNVQFGKGYKNFSYLFVKEADIDFSLVNFGEGDVSFKNSIFLDGEKNFRDAVFGPGSRNFNNVNFGNGNVFFIHTTYDTGKTSFKIAKFGKGIVDFHYSKFTKGDIGFEKTDFGTGNVDFSKVEFGNGRINFNRSVFHGELISFEGASLSSGRLIAKKCEFSNGILNFEYLNFKNANIILDLAKLQDREISFKHSIVNKLSMDSCNFNKYVNLHLQQCASLSLKDTIVRDIIDMQSSDNILKIDAFNFEGMQLLGIFLVEWEHNNLYQLIIQQKETSISQKAEQFRILKKSFSDTGRYDDEDAAYVEFKRFEAKAKLQKVKQKKILHRLSHYIAYWLQWLLFDKVGKYATDPIRVLISMFFVYVMFSSIYVLTLWLKLGDIASGIGGEHAQIGILAKSFFFGAITFLTIGYGDFYPMGIIRVLSGIEGFVGVFMMSYLVVAFVRKILR